MWAHLLRAYIHTTMFSSGHAPDTCWRGNRTMGNIVQLPRVQVIFEGREMFLRASQRTQQDLESTSKQNSRRGACVRGDGVQQLPDLMFSRHGMSGAGHRMFLFFRWQYCSVWQSIYSGLKQSMMHYLTVHYLTVRSRPKGSRGQTQSSPSGGWLSYII